MENLIDDVGQLSFKTKTLFRSKPIRNQKKTACEFVKRICVHRELINVAPITSRAVGFIATQCMEIAADKTTPKIVLTPEQQWSIIRACYTVFTARLSYVHEKCHVPPSMTRSEPITKHVHNQIAATRVFTCLKELFDQIGEFQNQKFIPSMFNTARTVVSEVIQVSDCEAMEGDNTSSSNLTI